MQSMSDRSSFIYSGLQTTCLYLNILLPGLRPIFAANSLECLFNPYLIQRSGIPDGKMPVERGLEVLCSIQQTF